MYFRTTHINQHFCKCARAGKLVLNCSPLSDVLKTNEGTEMTTTATISALLYLLLNLLNQRLSTKFKVVHPFKDKSGDSLYFHYSVPMKRWNKQWADPTRGWITNQVKQATASRHLTSLCGNDFVIIWRVTNLFHKMYHESTIINLK